MNKLSPELRPLIAELSPAIAADIEATIISSPHLMQQLNRAVQEDRLDHISLDKPNSHRGGYYDAIEKSIFIDPDKFVDGKYASKSQRLDVITGILGHEVEHGFQKENAQRSLNDLSYQIDMKIRNPDYMGQADMSQNIGVYINAARKHEADAEIASWNAVASRVSLERGGKPSRDELLERVAATTSCVLGEEKNLRPAPNLVLDPTFNYRMTG